MRMSPWTLVPWLLAAACGSPSAPPETGEPDAGSECAAFSGTTTARLQTLLDEERAKARALGMNLGVFQHGCERWTGSSGWADLAMTKPLVPKDRFRIYSITKTFTAALTFRAA